MNTVTLLFEFRYGQIVYLVTDPEQLPRMVTAFTIRGDKISYEVSLGTVVSWHMGIELSPEKVPT